MWVCVAQGPILAVDLHATRTPMGKMPAGDGNFVGMTEAQRTVQESHLDILDPERKAIAAVATIGPNGEPHCTPVWFEWDGSRLRFSQITTRQKYRNLQRNPRIAVSVMDPENPYRMVEIRGRVTFAEDGDRSFVDSLAKRYTGAERYEYDQPGDKRMIVTIEPEHVTYFG